MNSKGISLWRQISETLIGDMRNGSLKSGEQLPADVVIAERFGVNRHTVRQATAYLESEGLLRIERGRGTFVADDVLHYRLGSTTRFTENLLRQRRAPARKVLGVEEIAATAPIAEALRLKAGAPIVLLTLLGEADSAPLSLGRNYFPASRLEGIADEFRRRSSAKERFSITASLAAAGVDTYRRKRTQVGARMPDAEEARLLGMARTQPVIETESIDVASSGTPVTYARTCFRADRLQFVIET
jgi:GntR family transcriptional regulator, phosphonate transport system regulatory protein